MEKNHHQNISSKQHFQEKTAAFCAAHFLGNIPWTRKTLCAEHKRKTENGNLRLKFSLADVAAFISENSHFTSFERVNTFARSSEMCFRVNDRKDIEFLCLSEKHKRSLQNSFLSEAQGLETDVSIPQYQKDDTNVSNFKNYITRL